tara:strand:- start:309 stop:509 length:201 start_codon:yes stop_codon:yes gene_type:complete
MGLFSCWQSEDLFAENKANMNIKNLYKKSNNGARKPAAPARCACARTRVAVRPAQKTKTTTKQKNM